MTTTQTVEQLFAARTHTLDAIDAIGVARRAITSIANAVVVEQGNDAAIVTLSDAAVAHLNAVRETVASILGTIESDLDHAERCEVCEGETYTPGDGRRYHVDSELADHAVRMRGAGR